MNFRFGFHIVIFYQLFLLVLNYSYAIDKIIDMDSIEEDQGEICKDLVSSCADRVLAGQCHDHPE